VPALPPGWTCSALMLSDFVEHKTKNMTF
jgi:hypothetical protein